MKHILKNIKRISRHVKNVRLIPTYQCTQIETFTSITSRNTMKNTSYDPIRPISFVFMTVKDNGKNKLSHQKDKSLILVHLFHSPIITFLTPNYPRLWGPYPKPRVT